MIFSPNDIILSDFDDTQFKTDELKRDINRKAEELGIKDRYLELYEKELRGVYRDADRRVDDNYIDLELVCERLGLETGKDPKDIYQKLYLDHDFQSFVLPGTKEFFEYAKSFGVDLRLITQGDSFQNEKLRRSGICMLFESIQTTDDKPTLFRELIPELQQDGKKVWVIDDKPDILELAAQFGAKTIWIRYGKYAESKTELDVTFQGRNLGEVHQMIAPELFETRTELRRV